MMKTTRIINVLLGMALLMAMLAPPASAQPVFFHQQWWQGKLTFKGYQHAEDGTLGDQTNGGIKVWFYTRYWVDPQYYEVFTCGTTRVDDPDYYGWETGTMNRADLYFSSPLNQLWNWDNTTTGLPFTAIPYNITTYPVLLMKGKSATQASLSTVSCTAYVYDAALETYVLGPCTLKMKTIDASKVATSVPQACLDEAPY